MKEDKLQEDLEMRVELLTTRIVIADYMSRYSTDRREVDLPNEFLLEAVGKEAQRRLRAMREEAQEG